VRLEHDDSFRFTPEQRDEILSLAARLQTQHEATVDIDELARVAREAGIDPRFVHEAAMRVGRRTVPLPRSLLAALAVFTVQAGFFVFVQNPSVPGGRSLSTFELSFAIAMAFFVGLWVARERRIRWYAPLVSLGVWFALYLATTALTFLNGVRQDWVLQDCVAFGIAQAVAALFGAIAVAGLDRPDKRPAARTDFRLDHR
jgi:hypothetical protein